MASEIKPWKPEDNLNEYIGYVKKSRDGKYYVGDIYTDIRGNPCNRKRAKYSHRVILVNTKIGYGIKLLENKYDRKKLAATYDHRGLDLGRVYEAPSKSIGFPKTPRYTN